MVIARYIEYLGGEIVVTLDGFDVESHQLRYASLLWNYGVVKKKKNNVNENEDPPRPRPNCVSPLHES